jgi:hypothetical protein
MGWKRSSTVERLPADPLGESLAASVAEILGGASVELLHSPADGPPPDVPQGPAIASATGDGPPGWRRTVTIRLRGRIAPLVAPASTPLLEILCALPHAALRTAARMGTPGPAGPAPLSPPLRRALRDMIAIEALSYQHACAGGPPSTFDLIADTVEYLIELSGSRVEANDLTHGIVITDVLKDEPRLRFAYPADLRSAKRAPLLFDGQRSVLVVDSEGRARTELQRHRPDRLIADAEPLDLAAVVLAHTGTLVAEATRRLGGIGFFLRGDRTVWAFADGHPLLIRRAEHWTAFPLELATAIASAIGGSPATADVVVEAAFIISAERHGAILAIVDAAESLDGIVSPKDRYDLRDAVDPLGMQTETRLHHLIDASDLDSQTLARLAALDGAAILDRDGHLLAYGAIVTSADSQHEGARTAAAKTLSNTAAIVLKVSVDGDITVFRGGEVIATLLG